MTFFPRVRLKMFNDLTLYKPVIGSLTDEITGVALTEPIYPQMEVWFESGNHLTLAGCMAHTISEVPGHGQMISVGHLSVYTSKSDVLQATFGV